LADDLFRIGTVAKLTGLSVECLRAWERRHGIAPARRTGRTRFYSHAQLERLKKIKHLIDAGHPISSLAELTDRQLDARLAPTPPAPSPHRLVQVGLIGANLVLLEQDGADSDRVEINQRWVTIDDFSDSRERERAQLDVVALLLPTLNFEDFDRARLAAPDARWIVVYQFAARSEITVFEEQGVPIHAWPVPWAVLLQSCAAPTGAPLRAGRTAPRRFSDHELVAIASLARSRQREAPRQLVALITQLNAFTEFATRRAVTDAAEGPTYERLREDVSHARAQLERALAGVTELDPVALDR
jgi:DNA-binding transcriptional MerR regulator